MPSHVSNPPARADLTGTPAFWGTVGVTLMCLAPFAWWPARRAWIGCAVLVLWGVFFAINAMRSRRLHSLISAPVYLLAAGVVAGTAANVLDVQVWMVWLLGAGVIAANLSERVFGKYLR